MRVRAMACYAAGVDGLNFWDCQNRTTRLSGWAMHRLLGACLPTADFSISGDATLMDPVLLSGQAGAHHSRAIPVVS